MDSQCRIGVCFAAAVRIRIIIDRMEEKRPATASSDGRTSALGAATECKGLRGCEALAFYNSYD